MRKARAQAFDVAILDIKLPDVEGVKLLAPLKQMHPDIVVLMITGYASMRTAVQALNEGASAYITKPLRGAHLQSATLFIPCPAWRGIPVR